MDLYLDRRFLLRTRDRPFDNAEVRTNGIQPLYQSAVGQGYS